MLWVSHLGCDRKERRRSRESEDDHRNGRHEFRKTGISYHFDVGSERSSLWSSGWAVLNADCDSHSEDCALC
jgi:hypothetical protein